MVIRTIYISLIYLLFNISLGANVYTSVVLLS